MAAGVTAAPITLAELLALPLDLLAKRVRGGREASLLLALSSHATNADRLMRHYETHAPRAAMLQQCWEQAWCAQSSYVTAMIPVIGEAMSANNRARAILLDRLHMEFSAMQACTYLLHGSYCALGHHLPKQSDMHMTSAMQETLLQYADVNKCLWQELQAEGLQQLAADKLFMSRIEHELAKRVASLSEGHGIAGFRSVAELVSQLADELEATPHSVDAEQPNFPAADDSILAAPQQSLPQASQQPLQTVRPVVDVAIEVATMQEAYPQTPADALLTAARPDDVDAIPASQRDSTSPKSNARRGALCVVQAAQTNDSPASGNGSGNRPQAQQPEAPHGDGHHNQAVHADPLRPADGAADTSAPADAEGHKRKHSCLQGSAAGAHLTQVPDNAEQQQRQGSLPFDLCLSHSPPDASRHKQARLQPQQQPADAPRLEVREDAHAAAAAPGCCDVHNNNNTNTEKVPELTVYRCSMEAAVVVAAAAATPPHGGKPGSGATVVGSSGNSSADGGDSSTVVLSQSQVY
eukprot:jgi/Chlat1/6448/Chrsp45S05960